MKPLVFLTDFGLEGPFVGVMKGVVAKVNPSINVIDLSHGVESFNIAQAQFFLKNSLKYFPNNTVFCVVVDPGVGSNRRAIAVQSDESFFVGPDNGVLSIIFNNSDDYVVREITNKAFMEEDISISFHGRDIFAPCSAYLAQGESFEDVGPVIEDYLIVGEIPLKETIHGIEGGIDYIDKFGNIITNISGDKFSKKEVGAFICSNHKANFVTCYAEGVANELSCLVASHGNLEFFVKNASAMDLFNLCLEDDVVISFDLPV